ncbi:MAG TPA: TonB family protein [Pyrinomonadaceae bacterium]|jgi:TonB family protein
MRKTLAALALALAASAVCAGQTNAEAARQETNLGARAYRAGRFAEAEQRFRRALELDPEGKNLRVFIARAVHQQFKPGDASPENVAAGERAVAAYQDVLKADPANDDAYKAVVFLYGQMKNEQKVQELLLGRANDFSATNERRSEAFVILASKQWQCSHDVTEQRENKTTEQQSDKPVVKYKMPADQSDHLRARQCASDGLQLVEQALTLDPKHQKAQSYKVNLLLEAAKLAEMEGDAAQKAEYERQITELVGADRGKAEPGQQAEPDVVAPTGSPEPKGAVVSGGVLNGKAVSKPEPEYPVVAKAARASGTVTVQVVVDEEGNVISARAVSGHPLLQQAAVRAARAAKFSPTQLSGRPVKVSGVVTYNFVLEP